jgi:hypothetical protein
MLVKKLHLKPGMRFSVVNAPDGFKRQLGPLPDDVVEAKTLRGPLDLVLLFARDKKGLKAQWPKVLPELKQEGTLWIAYPKKSSGIESDLAMTDSNWEVNDGSPWQPVASIAVDETWSAIRFKHSPGLEKARERRPDEAILDQDGTVCVDRKNRIVTAPQDLQQLLRKNARAASLFESLSFTHKKEYVVWIVGAKRPETRSARLAATIEMLTKGKKNPSEK